MIDHKFTLEAAREALLGAQERAADLERALDHERMARLQAEERVAELEALLSDHEFCAPLDDDYTGSCPWCSGENEHHQCGHIDDQQPCPWGQAAANHRARQEEKPKNA